VNCPESVTLSVASSFAPISNADAMPMVGGNDCLQGNFNFRLIDALAIDLGSGAKLYAVLLNVSMSVIKKDKQPGLVIDILNADTIVPPEQKAVMPSQLSIQRNINPILRPDYQLVFLQAVE
jgi:hypothetical protein